MNEAARKEDFKELRIRLAECLPIGSPYEEVDRVLKSLGWDYKYHEGHNAFVATKKLKFRLFVTSSAQLEIELDDKKGVRAMKLDVLNTSWLG